MAFNFLFGQQGFPQNFINPEFFNNNPNNTQQADNKNVIPPASEKVLRSLPTVTVTADDLQEETNKECLICLDPHILGSKACKLPCGHLYHHECVTDWLKRHCTCPVCHFEFETSDESYERERKRRMLARKPRYRRDELERKTVSQLRELMTSLNISHTGCIDKRDLVDRLVSSGKVQVTEGVPTIEFSKEELYTMSVQELRHLLRSYGLSSVGAIEKRELINTLLESGRVSLKHSPDFTSKASESAAEKGDSKPAAQSDSMFPTGSGTGSGTGPGTGGSSDSSMKSMQTELEKNQNNSSEYNQTSTGICSNSYNDSSKSINDNNSNSHLKSTPSSTERRNHNCCSTSSGGFHASSSPSTPDARPNTSNSATSSAQQSSTGVYEMSESVLQTMPIKELKSIMTAFGISFVGCYERSDIIKRMEASNSIRIIRS